MNKHEIRKELTAQVIDSGVSHDKQRIVLKSYEFKKIVWQVAHKIIDMKLAHYDVRALLQTPAQFIV